MLDKPIEEAREFARQRAMAEDRAAARWRDVVRERLDARVLLPLSVEDRALIENLERRHEDIKALLREL